MNKKKTNKNVSQELHSNLMITTTFFSMVGFALLMVISMSMRNYNLAMLTIKIASFGGVVAFAVSAYLAYMAVKNKFTYLLEYIIYCMILGFGLIFMFNVPGFLVNFVMKNNITWFITTAVCGAAFVFCHLNKREFPIYLLWTITFTLLIIFVSMKVELGNKALAWLGNHVFSVYILQRLPMSVFDSIEAISSNRYLFFVLSFAVTVVLAEIFDRATGALDKVLFKKRIKK